MLIGTRRNLRKRVFPEEKETNAKAKVIHEPYLQEVDTDQSARC